MIIANLIFGASGLLKKLRLKEIYADIRNTRRPVA